MLINEIWEKVHPLSFKTSFAALWREDVWRVKLTDYHLTIDLKAQTLKEAFEEVKLIFLEKKYLEVKRRKVAREGKKAKKAKKVKKNVATKTKKSRSS